jgi:monofunctional glycosyltransferase
VSRRLLAWGARVTAAFVLVTTGAVVVYRFVDPPLTPLMVVRRAAVTKRWIPLDDMSPALVRAVIAAEDARFLVHHGIDVAAVRRAFAYNARHHGRHVHGAGTITMQCARNVFLWQGRSWVRKGLETYFAMLIELVWGKRRILEVYLNVIEWGDGIYGAEAAARRHFGVHAAQLDMRQAALLAAALPDPRRANPAAPGRYLAARAATIAARATRVDLRPLRVGEIRGRRLQLVAQILDVERADDDAIRPERDLDRDQAIGVPSAEPPAGDPDVVAAREEAAAPEDDGAVTGEPQIEVHVAIITWRAREKSPENLDRTRTRCAVGARVGHGRLIACGAIPARRGSRRDRRRAPAAGGASRRPACPRA